MVLVAGVFLLSARGGRELARIDRRAVGFALATALTICTYSVVDGIGVRLSRNPDSYVLWLFVGNALLLVPYALWRDGRDVVPAMRRFWRRGLAGGALQVVAYGTVLWAMTLAPIAIVATLARDQRAVRRRDRGRGAEGAAARDAHRRGAADCVRAGADPLTIKAECRHFALQPGQVAFVIDIPERRELDGASRPSAAMRLRGLGEHRAVPQVMSVKSSACGARAPINT